MASKAQDPGSGRRGGLFESLKVLAATLLTVAHTRLELLSTELEEQWVWFTSMLVWALVGLFCAAFGIVLATLFVVLALWHTHRLLALGVPAILFILGASASQIFSSRGTVGLLRPPAFGCCIDSLHRPPDIAY